jgi:acyl carrier protein
MPEILERIADVIRATMKQPHLRIGPETTADDVDGWDSLAHARLLMNIESAFGIRFVIADVLELENVGDLAAAVASTIAAAARPNAE